MNTLETKNFMASRQPNGGVFIEHGEFRQMILLVQKEDCAELARLLMWPVTSESHKVDYALSANEPE